MISCQTFHDTLQPGIHDADILAHLRACDACLDFAVAADPDLFFRALGGEEGEEMVPPGGVDAFVGDVMAQVRSRETETAVQLRQTPWWQRAAVAAMVASGLAAATLVGVHERRPVVAPVVQVAVVKAPLATKPVVESYDSRDATIVEVPSDAKDVQVVMIFDDKLPADL
jgi:hypothetical protein